MILGALVAAGVDGAKLTAELEKLNLPNYQIKFETVMRAGIAATKAHVQVPHEHVHRHLSDVARIINDSHLAPNVKTRALEIFTNLAAAEARVHNESIERVHFHEVGGLDAIIDIVGACIGFEMLEIERFVSSAVHVGSGTIDIAHGRYPVPPPAVVELMRDAPIYATDITGELLTPTGAAIIATLSESFGAMPLMRVSANGYGAGGREYKKFPNVLRVLIGETVKNDSKSKTSKALADDVTNSVISEQLLMLETNIDDQSAQFIGFVMDKAFAFGALDCFFTGVQMKKNRPATQISILCRAQDAAALRALLFTETTTIGIRTRVVERHFLPRRVIKVATKYGEIDVKISGDNLTIMPEFEQVRRAAEQFEIAVRTVDQAVRTAYCAQYEGELAPIGETTNHEAETAAIN